MSVWSLYQGKKAKIAPNPFNFRKAIKACIDTKWELAIPVLILFGVFGGVTTLVETAALTVVYIFLVEVYLYKDIRLRDLPRIVIDCATLIGGVLIILGVAMGLTSYLIDAQIPILMLSWAKSAIASKYTFLLMLNVFLLLVGCLMDIFQLLS